MIDLTIDIWPLLVIEGLLLGTLLYTSDFVIADYIPKTIDRCIVYLKKIRRSGTR
jgi:hypothetical protein